MARQRILAKDVTLVRGGQAVSQAKNATLTLTTSTEDALTKGNYTIFKTNEVVSRSWEISSDEFISANQNIMSLFDSWINNTEIVAKFGYDGTYQKGTVTIDSISVTANNKENAVFSVKLRGKGSLTTE